MCDNNLQHNGEYEPVVAEKNCSNCGPRGHHNADIWDSLHIDSKCNAGNFLMLAYNEYLYSIQTLFCLHDNSDYCLKCGSYPESELDGQTSENQENRPCEH